MDAPATRFPLRTASDQQSFRLHVVQAAAVLNDAPALPRSLWLAPNHPVPSAGRIRLCVCGLEGRTAELTVDRDQHPGEYEAEIRADAWAAGVYFLRLDAGFLD